MKRLLVMVCAVGIWGCGADTTGGSGGTGSTVTCPTDSTLTYDTFGKQFMTTYCTRCHSASVTGVNREGAPTSVNYDTLAQIQADKRRIDFDAGAGKSKMPDGDPRPTSTERQQLSEWIACGAK